MDFLPFVSLFLESIEFFLCLCLGLSLSSGSVYAYGFSDLVIFPA